MGVSFAQQQMSDRLFGLYRPLSTFAAKIDIAYALEITTDDIHAELNIMRKIRGTGSGRDARPCAGAGAGSVRDPSADGGVFLPRGLVRRALAQA
jgi:hypothetical protein